MTRPLGHASLDKLELKENLFVSYEPVIVMGPNYNSSLLLFFQVYFGIIGYINNTICGRGGCYNETGNIMVLLKVLFVSNVG